MTTTDPRIVDLFAGPRGWDTGARSVGIVDGVLGVEYDSNAHATALAAGHDGILADVSLLDPLEVCGTSLEGLIASPPCPGFSPAGKGLGRKDFLMLKGAIDDLASGLDPADVLEGVRARQHDERSALTLEPLRWALAAEPEWIAFEQVPTVLQLWEAYAPVLEAEGYNVWTGNLQAEQYGVPQTRKRAVLLASRSHQVGRPTPTHSKYHTRNPEKLDAGVEPWVSMAEALGWLEERTVAGRRPDVDPAGISFCATNVRPNAAVRAADQPAPTLAFGHERPQWIPTPAIEGETPADCEWVYDRPSPTIVGSFRPDVVAKPGYRKAGDPPRQKTPGSVRVTLAEASVLQSFPPDYPWAGAEGKAFLQVGNAVPPLLSAAVMRELRVEPSSSTALTA